MIAGVREETPRYKSQCSSSSGREGIKQVKRTASSEDDGTSDQTEVHSDRLSFSKRRGGPKVDMEIWILE